MKGAQVDIISNAGGGLSGSGDVAMRLLENGFNINALRTNAVLRKDEWLQFDTALIEVARDRLKLVAMLVGANLSFNISNGLGTTILEWEQVSDMEPANVSMAGVTRGDQDTLEFTLQSMPLPIIHTDFTLNIRKLEASRTLGQPLDTAQASLAGRLVAEQTESMVIAGHATRVGSAQIFGLTNAPNLNVVAMSGTTNWDTDATGAQILADVLTSIAALQNDNMYGPYALLVNYAQWNRLLEDFKTNSDKTILQRLRELEDVNSIVASKQVPTGEAYFIQLTRDVIDEVIGLQPTTVQWESQGGMQLHFKIMSIMIPRVRSTVTGQSGVAKIS